MLFCKNLECVYLQIINATYLSDLSRLVFMCKVNISYTPQLCLSLPTATLQRWKGKEYQSSVTWSDGYLQKALNFCFALKELPTYVKLHCLSCCCCLFPMTCFVVDHVSKRPCHGWTVWQRKYRKRFTARSYWCQTRNRWGAIIAKRLHSCVIEGF